MSKSKALLQGIVGGLSSPGSLLEAGRYPKLAGSDLERMRGDVQRVGRDFAVVIEREQHGKKNRSSAPIEPASVKPANRAA